MKELAILQVKSASENPQMNKGVYLGIYGAIYKSLPLRKENRQGEISLLLIKIRRFPQCLEQIPVMGGNNRSVVFFL